MHFHEPHLLVQPTSLVRSANRVWPSPQQLPLCPSSTHCPSPRKESLAQLLRIDSFCLFFYLLLQIEASFYNVTFQVTKGILSIGAELEHQEGYLSLPTVLFLLSPFYHQPSPIKLIHHQLESLKQNHVTILGAAVNIPKHLFCVPVWAL